MSHRIGVAVLMLALAPIGACRRGAQTEAAPESVYSAPSVLSIRIVNHSQLDAIVYLLHDGTRDRLGAVTAATTAHFQVRSRVLSSGEFALLADPVGSLRTTTSELLHTTEGTEFTWTLETDYDRGSVIVRED